MKLTFIGTRGEIEARTARHRLHTSLLVEYRGRRVRIDAGADWLGRLAEYRPHAIVVTHAHPDHAFGLKHGAPCPVWMPPAVRDAVAAYPIAEPRAVEPRAPVEVEGILFEAFPVEHSIRAPAVGYRIRAGAVTVWYSPDVLHIPDRSEALRDARLYIGDGATMERSFVRRRGGVLVGHAPVRTQLTWCQKEAVPRAIVTHCGSEIVEGDEAELGARLQELADARGVEATIAHDGMELVLR